MKQNGVKRQKQVTQAFDLPLNSGWFQFYFGAADTPTAYSFSFNYSDYIQISITDAYCTGDSFDLYRNGQYLLTTPRVLGDKCQTWNPNPNVTFLDARWSSTKFMLPGVFNLSISVKDSPFGGGAAFIRADTRLATCQAAVSPFILVTEPLVGNDQAAAACARVGGVPAHITPVNALAASQTLSNCIGDNSNAWFGQLSLVRQRKLKSTELGCLAFTNANPTDPTVHVADCQTLLPVLCLPA